MKRKIAIKTVQGAIVEPCAGWTHWRLEDNADGTVKLTADVTITKDWAQYLRDCVNAEQEGTASIVVPSEVLNDMIGE